MSETIVVTSCKGGIGKSTVAANLSMALAMSGFSVLAVDCDFTMRSLDLIMGLENAYVFNLLDVINKSCEAEKAIVKDSRREGLYFLAAPPSGSENITVEGFESALDGIKKNGCGGQKLDYIIIDAPAADSMSVRLAASVSNQAVIVCSHMPTAIRAAGLTADILARYGVENRRLLINSFDADSALHFNRAGILEMIDESKVMLLGIVPYDRKLMISQEKGELIDSFPKKNNARQAFLNIAGRIEGAQIPLFSALSGAKYRRLTHGGNSR